MAVPGRFGSAALLVVSRRVFDEVGGFDPRFFLYVEDLDLWDRLSERGPVGFVPGVLADHRSGTGSEASVALRTVLRWLGRESFFLKRSGRWRLLRAVHVLALLALKTPDDPLGRHVTSGLLRWRAPGALQLDVARLAKAGSHGQRPPLSDPDRCER